MTLVLGTAEGGPDLGIALWGAALAGYGIVALLYRHCLVRWLSRGGGDPTVVYTHVAMSALGCLVIGVVFLVWALHAIVVRGSP
jgi:hypothetical protein